MTMSPIIPDQTGIGYIIASSHEASRVVQFQPPDRPPLPFESTVKPALRSTVSENQEEADPAALVASFNGEEPEESGLASAIARPLSLVPVHNARSAGVNDRTDAYAAGYEQPNFIYSYTSERPGRLIDLLV
jgi:hypothetical protein